MRLVVPFLVIIALIAGALALDRAPERADLVFVNRGEIFTLDPQRMSWMQDFRMAYSLFEGLVRWNSDDGSIEPAAAQSWRISDDGLTYTFNLRRDARWSNGEPVTAHDFIYAWSRALMPETAADYTMMFFNIAGAQDFFSWRSAQLQRFSTMARPEASTPGESAEALWERTEQRFDESVGVRAIDEHTLQVTLVRPLPYFLDLAAFPAFYPVHRPTVEGWTLDEASQATARQRGWHAIRPPPFRHRRWLSLDAASGSLQQQHGWTKPGTFVGNGPYILAEWRYKRGLRLQRNPHFHSPHIVRSDSVACLSIDDTNTAVMAFETGEIEWLSEVSAEYQSDMLEQRARYIERYRGKIDEQLALGRTMDEALAALPPPDQRNGERRNIHVLPTFGTDFYSFNCRPTLADGRENPFADARVRRAFVLSADRELLVRTVTRLHEPVMTTLIPPDSIPGYSSPAGLGLDVDAARRELADAGWLDRDRNGIIENRRGVEFPVVDLLYSTNTSRYKDLSLALRDMWQRELGVRIELRGKDNKFFKEDLIRGNFMIGRGRWYGDYGDPTTFLNIFRTGDGNNDRGYSNPRIDDLLDEADVERDPRRRMELLSECERILFQEEAPMLVICQLVQLYMYEPGELRGLTHHPRLVQYLWRMEVDR
jgi:oligopeptide transport system substrate-binding protein